MTVVTFSISHMGRIANVSVSTASGDATLDTICYQPYDVFKAALRDVRSTTDLHRSVPFSVISIRTHRAHYRVSTVHKKGSARQLWVTNVERNGADSDYAEIPDINGDLRGAPEGLSTDVRSGPDFDCLLGLKFVGRLTNHSPSEP